MNATIQPLPEVAGVAGAAAGSIQMTAGAASSGLVAILFDGRRAVGFFDGGSDGHVFTACVDRVLPARPSRRTPDVYWVRSVTMALAVRRPPILQCFVSQGASSPWRPALKGTIVVER
jgi:MFS transporter, DHA1 family, multidrug resistance protein